MKNNCNLELYSKITALEDHSDDIYIYDTLKSNNNLNNKFRILSKKKQESMIESIWSKCIDSCIKDLKYFC